MTIRVSRCVSCLPTTIRSKPSPTASLNRLSSVVCAKFGLIAAAVDKYACQTFVETSLGGPRKGAALVVDKIKEQAGKCRLIKSPGLQYRAAWRRKSSTVQPKLPQALCSNGRLDGLNPDFKGACAVKFALKCDGSFRVASVILPTASC